MKRVIKFLAIPSLALLFSACGGGGNSGDIGDGGNGDLTTNTNISIVDCNSSEYTNVKVNDLLVKDTDDATVKIVHDSNGTKQICVLTGVAHLVREN